MGEGYGLNLSTSDFLGGDGDFDERRLEDDSLEPDSPLVCCL
jgi:hypothetical protein